jgi:anion transporter
MVFKDKTMAIKWGLNLCVPILIKLFGPNMGLPPVIATYLAITVWAILGWILETLPENLIAILMPAFYVVFAVGQGKQIFSPWASEIPWLVAGGMMMGMIMMQTGLSKRIALWSIRISGLSFVRVMVGLMLAGLIISPFVPSVMGKAAIISVICLGICDALKLKPGSREGSTVLLVGFLSVACPKLAYLTGGGDIVIAMKLAGEVAGTPISWMEYFIHNFPLAILYAVMSFVLVILILRPKLSDDLTDYVNNEYTALGAVSIDEKKSIGILITLLLLMFTDKIHGVPAGYVLLFMGGICFLPGIDLLDKEKLSKMNFGVIFFVVGSMCIGSAAQAAGIDVWFADLIAPHLQGSQTTSLLGFYGVGLIANFFLTPLAAVAALTGPFAQIAQAIHIPTNVATYCLIFGIDQYIFPYEYAVLLYFYSQGYMKIKHIILTLGARAILTVLFLLAIAIPYWKVIGIL